MPVISGFIARSSDSGYTDPGYISDDLDDYSEAWVGSIATHASVARAVAGALTGNLPVEANGAARTGFIARSYSDDFYYRVHVSPARVDLGSIVTQTQATIYVWNAHFGNKTLAQIVAAGTLDGLTLSGQPPPPIAFGPLAERAWTLTASTAGAPTIEASYTFDFGAESPAVAVTGRRIVVWSFGPNWAEPVRERLGWATDVLLHDDGTEQRVRLRAHARRSIAYSALASASDAQRMDALLFGWGGRTYLLPVWWEADVLIATLAAGATSATVTDAALKDYAADGFAVLIRGADAEAVQIASVAGNVLTFALPTQRTWPAGSRLCPGVLARIDGLARLARPTDGIVGAQLAFAEDESRARDRTAAEIGPSFGAYSVLDLRPDRAQDIDEEWGRTLDVLDSIAGMVAVEDRTGAAVIRRRLLWTLRGRAAIDQIKRWAAARAGRCNPVWLPSWADDLRLVQTVGSSDTSLRVANTLSARTLGAVHPLRAALRLELANGAVYHRLVTGLSEFDAGTEVIAIDSALGVIVQTSDVRRLMWMSLARLDADALELVYATDDLVQLEATFRLVVQ